MKGSKKRGWKSEWVKEPLGIAMFVISIQKGSYTVFEVPEII